MTQTSASPLGGHRDRSCRPMSRRRSSTRRAASRLTTGGLDWDKVRYIRSSAASNRALARELGVSDVLISKVRHGLVWHVEPEPRRRNDIPRLAICATLTFAGLRNRELCMLDGEHMDF